MQANTISIPNPLSLSSQMFFTHIILTIRQLYQFYEDEMYFMDPDWQRDPVWSNKEKLAFINSVFYKNSPIPELCIWERPDGVKIPVDGKQRSTSIFEFLQDSFSIGDDVWFSGLSQEDMDSFLNKEINILLLGRENSEDEVISYYHVRNTTGKPLSPGEKLKAWNTKPIMTTTKELFESRTEQIKNAFGDKKEAKRSGDLANRCQYLASFVSSLDYLTKKIDGISSILVDTTQDQVNAVLPQFTEIFDKHIAVCKRVVDENPEQKAKWKGFPPLGKVSSVWVSLVEPELIDGRDPLEFWSEFYGKLRASNALKNAWEEKTRKNVNPNGLRSQIAWAKQTISE